MQLKVPLTEGEIPFKLPPGLYTDVDGVAHNTSDARWSISEEDLFKGVVEEEEGFSKYTTAILAAAAGIAVFSFVGYFMRKKK